MTLTQGGARQYRLHQMERATVVLVGPDGKGGEFANCLNSFGDQDENARLIVDALNAHSPDSKLEAYRKALEEIRKYCDENLGPSRSSLLNKIAHVADQALAKDSRP